jgi:hypothetical protein
MKNLSNKVLLKQESFMMGHAFNGLSIVSYLQCNKLLISNEAEKPKENERVYALKEGGKISICYDKYNDLAQVTMHEGTSENIAEDLRKIGNQNRERRNQEKYGLIGVY